MSRCLTTCKWHKSIIILSKLTPIRQVTFWTQTTVTWSTSTSCWLNSLSVIKYSFCFKYLSLVFSRGHRKSLSTYRSFILSSIWKNRCSCIGYLTQSTHTSCTLHHWRRIWSQSSLFWIMSEWSFRFHLFLKKMSIWLNSFPHCELNFLNWHLFTTCIVHWYIFIILIIFLIS